MGIIHIVVYVFPYTLLALAEILHLLTYLSALHQMYLYSTYLPLSEAIPKHVAASNADMVQRAD